VNLVLSIFPGIDLLGRAFEAEGFCVVRGPDTLWGGDIAAFNAPRGVFAGVIGGPPCQDFSCARRCPPTGEGVRLLGEFARVVTQVNPDWWLLENVTGCPDVSVQGFIVQRFNLSASECGARQRRLRRFQFGSRDGAGLVIVRSDTPANELRPCCLASEGQRQGRRSWGDFCELQGLPRDFDIPHVSMRGKYVMVGNGVPLPMGRVLAIAVKTRGVTQGLRVCVCDCGRPVDTDRRHATAACRKRMERRRRDTAGVTEPGPVAIDASQRLIWDFGGQLGHADHGEPTWPDDEGDGRG
jgi:DNA (cytosine-5)-methyltransferase 1